MQSELATQPTSTHTICMRHVLSLFWLALLLIHTPQVYGQNSAQNEFEIKTEKYKDRIEDFYTRLNRVDKLSEIRKKGESKMREERMQAAKEYEQKRLAYVLKQKNTPPRDPSAWEAEEKRRVAEHEKKRRAYVEERRQLERVMRSVGSLSGEEEYDLYIYEGEFE